MSTSRGDEVRQQLIKDGLIKPGTGVPVKRNHTPGPRSESAKDHVEFLAKQLYNVFRTKAQEIDNFENLETWEEMTSAEDKELLECFRAQALYVSGTYRELDRLRYRLKRAEESLNGIGRDLEDGADD